MGSPSESVRVMSMMMPPSCWLEKLETAKDNKKKESLSASQVEEEESKARKELREERRAYAEDPIYLETIKMLSTHGFTLQMFIHKMAVQRSSSSSNKKANEVYSWGDVIRRKDELSRRRQMMGALGILSGVLVVGAAPMALVAGPLALVPLGLGLGIGGAAMIKASPAGLISAVAGCLQQRLALSYHSISIDDYYTESAPDSEAPIVSV